MATREELYAVLGELAVTFSNLEHNVVLLLDVFVRGDEFLGPILLDDLNISRVLRYLRTYIKARLRDNSELCNRAELFVSDVEKVRADRNLFIHGHWITKKTLLASGHVSCYEYKLRYNEKEARWECLHEHKFTLNQLAAKTAKTMILCDHAMLLWKEVEAYLDQRK